MRLGIFAGMILSPFLLLGPFAAQSARRKSRERPREESMVHEMLGERGLDFGRDQSVTADDARVLIARDPAPPAIRLLRGFGGETAQDAVCQRRKDPNMPSNKTIKKVKARSAGKR